MYGIQAQDLARAANFGRERNGIFIDGQCVAGGFRPFVQYGAKPATRSVPQGVTSVPISLAMPPATPPAPEKARKHKGCRPIIYQVGRAYP